MRARISVLVLGFVTLLFGCWATGQVAGDYFGASLGLSTTTPVPTDTPLPSPAATRATAATSQISILLLVVDDHATAMPQFDGCWVLTFQPGIAQYFLVGFPLNTPVGATRTLQDYFYSGQTLEDRSQLVRDAIRTVTNGGLPTQFAVTVDHKMIAEMADRLGEITLGDETLTGDKLLERFASLPADDPLARLHFQGETLQSFTNALGRQTWTAADLRRLVDRYPQASPDLDELLALAVQALPLNGAQFTIRYFHPPSP